MIVDACEEVILYDDRELATVVVLPRFVDGTGKNDDPDSIGAFAAWLGNRYQDWQVHQAKEAVGFYTVRRAALTVRSMRNGKQKSSYRQ